MAEANIKVLCSFCDEEFTSPKVMGEHLMMCGNKTDQCPNCNKFIRRAIFAYHYENECANPDEPTADHRTDRKPPKSSGVQVTVICPFCNSNQDKADSRLHRENCLLNPKNVAKNQQQSTHVNSNSNKDRSDDGSLIPCEYCNTGIPWDRYAEHSNACQDEEYNRKQKQKQNQRRRNSQDTTLTTTTATPTATTTTTTKITNATNTVPSIVNCVFCKMPRTMEGLSYHQLICKMNPRRTGTH